MALDEAWAKFPDPTGVSLDGGPSGATPLLLVEEISHRVVNEYTGAIGLIASEAAGATEPAARAALMRIEAHLRTLAEAHRALQAPIKPDEVDLIEYLDRLCAAVSAAILRARRINLLLAGDSVSLAPQTCWRVGLIVAELITNAVRHGLGGGGAIVVEVRALGRRLECRVADSGGQSSDPGPSRGRGIVARLAQDLGGSVSWRFEPYGVTAILSVPLYSNGVAVCDAALPGCDAPIQVCGDDAKIVDRDPPFDARAYDDGGRDGGGDPAPGR